MFMERDGAHDALTRGSVPLRAQCIVHVPLKLSLDEGIYRIGGAGDHQVLGHSFFFHIVGCFCIRTRSNFCILCLFYFDSVCHCSVFCLPLQARFGFLLIS